MEAIVTTLESAEQHIQALYDFSSRQAARIQALEAAMSQVLNAYCDLNERYEALNEDASDQHIVVNELNKAYENLLMRVQRLEDRLCATIRKPGSETS